MLGLWHWVWHTLATYSYIKLTNLRYLSESIMVLSESHKRTLGTLRIPTRSKSALVALVAWRSKRQITAVATWLISWWLPGLVNIQKAIENGYLWCIFPLIALPEGKPAKRNHNIAERAAGRHRKNMEKCMKISSAKLGRFNQQKGWQQGTTLIHHWEGNFLMSKKD